MSVTYKHLTFSIRLSYLCPILSHSDCSVIYLKQNVTIKYYIQNKSTFYLSSNIKYEACNVNETFATPRDTMTSN